MGFMDFIREVGCNVGLHDWSEWVYVSAGGCRQSSKCTRKKCKEAREQLAHSWSKWIYCGPGPCDARRTCERCGSEEKQAIHNWDIWKRESPVSCVQVRFCRRCDLKDRERTPKSHEDHDMRPEDVPKVTCYGRLGKCPRCSAWVAVPFHFPQHDWGPWMESPKGRIRNCGSCKETERA